MARLSLTKASLTKEKSLLRTFQDVLPSLDMKRRQIGAAREKARRLLAEAIEKAAAIEPDVAVRLPMVANKSIDLTDLVAVSSLEIGEENLMGTRLPVLQSLAFRVIPYGVLTKPFWVDALVVVLQQAMEQSIRIQVARRRVEQLEQAERIVTQRYNLFDKVLIPRARQNIRKISIYLADAERAGVVNSKIAKRKKEHQVL
ncbi:MULTISPECIES: V-type ATP synthase subunit D [unclassified Cyanobium]|uniref:V-type ATP synthase subunit D n=1 Tax=unclassified Cyanobium TaxID=2627006 RepID=UPI0020CDA17F|nr:MULTISPECIES: V-type ATP synthase subunit D [unclassified Cyanobium]MCP9859960.1 V-type ATP synthase subunit D [Cyanobium sp. Cruz-8H5]MCP9867148.1 V-type ATP synthase subunit D [Cyanobium sp. Cruz-8D1]